MVLKVGPTAHGGADLVLHTMSIVQEGTNIVLEGRSRVQNGTEMVPICTMMVGRCGKVRCRAPEWRHMVIKEGSTVH